MSKIISQNHLENNSNYKQKQKNNKNSKTKGMVQIAAGGYFGTKAITSGLRRTLGVRIEEHTTSKIKAKEIIKNGCILDPNFGGTGCSKANKIFCESSQNYVHITGCDKEGMKQVFEKLSAILPFEDNTKAKFNKLVDSPIRNAFGNIYRKIQKITYRNYSQELTANILNQTLEGENVGLKKKDILATILNIFTGCNSKTFYISGDEKFFKENFIPDTDDFALKTDKPLKVYRSKIEATLEALKKNGLSGIKQNKTRSIAGIAMFSTFSYFSYKLIKSGIKKIQNSKKDSNNNQI